MNLYPWDQSPQVGKAEFLGRATGRPHVDLEDSVEPYTSPHLEWFQVRLGQLEIHFKNTHFDQLGTLCIQIYRGSEDSGELLAAFELFELGDSGRCERTILI